MGKFLEYEVFQFPSRKSVIQTWFCNCPQYLCFFRIVVESTPSIHDPRKMLVLPNRLLYWVLSTSDQDFVSFQPILCHPHTQIRIILFSRWTKRHSQFGIFSHPCFNRIFSIAFHITVLPKDDHTDSCQEEQLDLPYWTMIEAICVVVDVSKYLDTPILEFSITSVHLPFWPRYMQILHPLFVLRILAVWIWYPLLLLPSFVMLMILVLWILHKIQNPLLHCHFGVQLEMTKIHQRREMNFSALVPCFFDHLFLSFCQLSMPIFSPVFFFIFSPLQPLHLVSWMLEASE